MVQALVDITYNTFYRFLCSNNLSFCIGKNLWLLLIYVIIIKYALATYAQSTIACKWNIFRKTFYQNIRNLWWSTLVFKVWKSFNKKINYLCDIINCNFSYFFYFHKNNFSYMISMLHIIKFYLISVCYINNLKWICYINKFNVFFT